MDEDSKNKENTRTNIAAIFILNCYVFPKVSKTLELKDNFYANTVYQSLINDKHLVIVPENKPDCVATLVELEDSHPTEENGIILYVVGLRRIKVKDFFRARLNNPVSCCLLLNS